MWIARTGSQWRHLPDDYGRWNSVFRRYRRWVTTGVFDAMLEILAEMVGRDTNADMIDSTVIRAHHCAIGIKKGLRKPGRLADRAVVLPPDCTPDATSSSSSFPRSVLRFTCWPSPAAVSTGRRKNA